MTFGIYPKLTKTYILEKLTQEQIFEYYFEIPVVLDTLIKSPIRTEENPSFGFKYVKGGKLRARDFAGYFWGDCFDAVAFTISVDASNKQGFNKVLHTIAEDFGIHKYENVSVKNLRILPQATRKVSVKSKKKRLEVKPREWNNIDVQYWTQFFFDKVDLKDVYPCNFAWVNKHLVYQYDPKDPCYIYYFGKDEGEHIYKLYFPKRKKARFMSNKAVTQGINLLPRDGGETLIITKSYKDVLLLYKMGFHSIAPPAESSFLSIDELDIYDKLFKNLVIFYDNDVPGISNATKFSERYELPSIIIPTQSDVKDISDFVKLYGYDTGKELMNQLINETTN